MCVVAVLVGDSTLQGEEAGQEPCLDQPCILDTVTDPVLQQVLLEGGTGDAAPRLGDLQGLLQQCGHWAAALIAKAKEQDDHSKQQYPLRPGTAANSAQPNSAWLLKQQLFAAVEQHQQQQLAQQLAAVDG